MIGCVGQGLNEWLRGPRGRPVNVTRNFGFLGFLLEKSGKHLR